MGRLQVDGTLDLKQFWPTGSSDGDTAHVTVKRTTFDGKATRAFDGAHVRGRGTRAVIDEHCAITVRFQGIDAPELHFMPSISKAKAKKQNANFRQHYARAAAQALGKFLHTLGTDTVKCRVVTEVSKPNDVFDTYGRFPVCPNLGIPPLTMLDGLRLPAIADPERHRPFLHQDARAYSAGGSPLSAPMPSGVEHIVVSSPWNAPHSPLSAPMPSGVEHQSGSALILRSNLTKLTTFNTPNLDHQPVSQAQQWKPSRRRDGPVRRARQWSGRFGEL